MFSFKLEIMEEQHAEYYFEYDASGYMFEPEYNNEEVIEREEQERVAAQQQAADAPLQRTLGDWSVWCKCGQDTPITCQRRKRVCVAFSGNSDCSTVVAQM